MGDANCVFMKGILKGERKFNFNRMYYLFVDFVEARRGAGA